MPIFCAHSPTSLWLCDESASNRNVVVRIWIHPIKKPQVRVLDGPPPPRACNPNERDCKMLCEKLTSFNNFSQFRFSLCISGCAVDVNGSTYGAVMFFHKAGGLCICPGMHSLISFLNYNFAVVLNQLTNHKSSHLSYCKSVVINDFFSGLQISRNIKNALLQEVHCAFDRPGVAALALCKNDGRNLSRSRQIVQAIGTPFLNRFGDKGLRSSEWSRADLKVCRPLPKRVGSNLAVCSRKCRNCFMFFLLSFNLLQKLCAICPASVLSSVWNQSDVVIGEIQCLGCISKKFVPSALWVPRWWSCLFFLLCFRLERKSVHINILKLIRCCDRWNSVPGMAQSSVQMAAALFTFGTAFVVPFYTTMILAPQWKWVLLPPPLHPEGLFTLQGGYV